MASSSSSYDAVMVCARQGWHQQRYKGSYRLVSGCIPYMLKDDDGENSCVLKEHALDRLQVLMISTPKSSSQRVDGKTTRASTKLPAGRPSRKAFEEAGVKGTINEAPLGEWIFKSKSKQNSCDLEGACKGFMFALQVTELLESWPEQVTHGRRWVRVEEAYGLCRYDWMREALDKLKEQLLFGSSFSAPPSPELLDSASQYVVIPAVAEGAVALCGTTDALLLLLMLLFI